jgi:hypothetical protein
MKTRRLTKKYRNKIKNKSRKRILKGGVKDSSVARKSYTKRPSATPISVVRHSAGKQRSSSTLKGVKKHSSRGIIKKGNCCDRVTLSHGQKIIRNITDLNLPADLKLFYDSLLDIPLDDLPREVERIKEWYITRTTIQPSGSYLNMNGLILINYLRSKYKDADDSVKEKIKKIISLFDQFGMSQGVRVTDLPIVQSQVSESYFTCYKNLYDNIYAKLFSKKNYDEYPLTISAIPFYCQSLQTVVE